MKVKLLVSGDVFEAKRFKDMSPAEIDSATNYPSMWDPDDVFAFIDGDPWYVGASEVEILKEVKTMNFKEYQQAALRTAGDSPDIRNCQLGLAGEAGEFADLIKKWYFHGHELDKVKALKELGDVLWYAAVTCYLKGTDCNIVGVIYPRIDESQDDFFIDTTIELAELSNYLAYVDGDIFALLRTVETLAHYLGSSLDEVMQMNIDKLMARYPDGFSAEKSINREDE